ncbi:glycosyltransferase family 4 protein [Marinobacter sp. DUT-1]|uniref:glycosyltransferase family 4 protein n=1 Tax=Marinobacter sp. DUT-1 TaxID=3412037 RepID=UPI003D17DB04
MEKHTADLAGALATLGHEVHVLAHPSYRQQFGERIQFHPCPMQLGRRNPWLSYRVRRVVSALNPDVVHAQGSKAATMVSRLRLTSGCQKVGTVHGSKSTEKPFLQLDKVIAVSTPVYDSLTHPRKFRIFNGIDVQQSDETVSGVEEYRLPSAINVVAAGRLEPVKGFRQLISAWPGVLAQFPSAHLTIFGDGSEKTGLLEQAHQLGCSDSITLAGYLTGLMPVLEQADLLVISSEREGFPYILVEALMTQCLVVSTPVAGCVEILPNEAIAPDHSVTALSTLIIAALSAPGELRRQEQRAFDYARAHLTLEAMANATLEVYVDPVSDD